MRALRWSAQADRDLVRIRAFLEQTDANLAADALMALSERLRLIRQNPAIGSPLAGGSRKMIERRFGCLVFYRIDGDRLTILRIRHAREDWC